MITVDRRLAYLGTVVVAPWVAISGGLLLGLGFLARGRPWSGLVGGIMLWAAVEVGSRAYHRLKGPHPGSR